jgi:hypothetical protein
LGVRLERVAVGRETQILRATTDHQGVRRDRRDRQNRRQDRQRLTPAVLRDQPGAERDEDRAGQARRQRHDQHRA